METWWRVCRSKRGISVSESLRLDVPEHIANTAKITTFPPERSGALSIVRLNDEAGNGRFLSFSLASGSGILCPESADWRLDFVMISASLKPI